MEPLSFLLGALVGVVAGYCLARVNVTVNVKQTETRKDADPDYWWNGGKPPEQDEE